MSEAGSGWLCCELILLREATGSALVTKPNLHRPGEHHFPYPSDSLRPSHPTLVPSRLIQLLSLMGSWLVDALGLFLSFSRPGTGGSCSPFTNWPLSQTSRSSSGSN